MMGDPRMIGQSLSLILIARNLERIGDHATNIAEEVIYWIHGRDIRHQGSRQRQQIPAGDDVQPPRQVAREQTQGESNGAGINT